MEYCLVESVDTWAISEPVLAFELLAVSVHPHSKQTGREGGERAGGIPLKGRS